MRIEQGKESVALPTSLYLNTFRQADDEWVRSLTGDSAFIVTYLT